MFFFFKESDKPGIPRIQDIRRPAIIRELRSEVLQLKPSAVPPNLTKNLEAKIESHKTEIQSLHRDLQTTQDSLNSWDEVKLNSIQGVCVDESVATSTSSVSSTTEPISHLSSTISWG